jgi:hypothetical protein
MSETSKQAPLKLSTDVKKSFCCRDSDRAKFLESPSRKRTYVSDIEEELREGPSDEQVSTTSLHNYAEY